MGGGAAARGRRRPVAAPSPRPPSARPGRRADRLSVPMRSLRVPRLLLVASVAFAVAACGAGQAGGRERGRPRGPPGGPPSGGCAAARARRSPGSPCGGQPAEGESAATACDRVALSGELLWLAVAPYAEAHDITAALEARREQAVAQLETQFGADQLERSLERPRPDARRPPRAGAEGPHDPGGPRGGRRGTDRRRRAPIPVRGARAGVHERRGEPHPARDEGGGTTHLRAGEGRDPGASSSPSRSRSRPSRGADESGGESRQRAGSASSSRSSRTRWPRWSRARSPRP